MDLFNLLFQSLYNVDLRNARCSDDATEVPEKTRQTTPHEPTVLSTIKSAYYQKQIYQKALEIWRLSFETRGIDILNKGNKKEGYSATLKNVAALMIKRSKKQFATLWKKLHSIPEQVCMEISSIGREKRMKLMIRICPIYASIRDSIKFMIIRYLKY